MKKFLLTIVLFLIFINLSATYIEASGSKEIKVICGAWINKHLQEFKAMWGYDLIERFSQETGIKVRLEGYPFRQLLQTIELKMNMKDSDLDVIWVGSPQTASYAVRGYIKPVKKDNFPKIKWDDFYPAVLEMGKWKDELYSVPFRNSSQFMYINKELFKKAGIKPPLMDIKQRWTWEHVVAVSQKIQKTLNTRGKEKVWGLVFDQVSRPYQMLVLPQSLQAGSGVSPDGLHVNGYLNNKGWLNALQWWYDCHNTWEICPKGVKRVEMPKLFMQGKAAMFIGGTWHTPFCLSAMKNDGLQFDIVPHPYFKDGTPVTPTGSWHLSISNYSKNPGKAAEFITYMVSRDMSEKLFKATGHLTADKVISDIILHDDNYNRFPLNAFKYITFHELAKTAVPRPVTPFYMEWEDAVFQLFEEVRNGGKPGQTLDKYTTLLEEIAAQYR